MPASKTVERVEVSPKHSSKSDLTCTRKVHFCAGHRVMGHENKCKHLHGHNYDVYITARAERLDEIGRVVDFSVLKGTVGSWIDENWDHGFLLWDRDEEAIATLSNFLNGEQKLFLMPSNPTAENIASYVLDIGNSLLEGSGVKVVKVVVWETQNCFAEANYMD